MYNEEFNHTVAATVIAEPLPKAVQYREAVVRFECTAASIDYKFMQGEKPDPTDPPENPIIIINMIIDLILRGDYISKYDLDSNGEINITDLNIAIDRLLNS